MLTWFKSLLHTGNQSSLTLLEQNALLITNIGLVTAIVVNAVLMLFTPALGAGFVFKSFLGYGIAAASYVICFLLIHKHQYTACRTLFSITLISVITYQTYMFGIHSGMQWFLFPIGIGSVLIWPLMRLPQLIVGLITLTVFLYLLYVAPGGYIVDRYLQSQYFEFLAWINYSLSFMTTFIVVFSMVVVTERFQHLLESLHQQASQRAMNREEQMMAALNALALARDNETGNHIIRTQYYVKTIADHLIQNSLFQDEINTRIASLLFKAAPLHDIGKIGIPDYILLKPGPLTESEWEIMKTHTSIGESVLMSAEQQYAVDASSSEDVVMVGVQIAGCHHEKWDGSGYPRGLAGRSIPLPARIMAIADMYDALVTERVYKKQWSHEQAVAEISSKSGTHFDPELVDAFLRKQEKFKTIAERFRD